MENALINEDLNFAKLTNGIIKDFFKERAKRSTPVKVSRAADILSKAYCERIREQMEIKQCFKNAATMCNICKGMKYVEGKVLAGIPIDHAFNKYTDPSGNVYYFDFTFEFALNEDPTKYEYIAYAEYKRDELWDVLIEQGFYGDVFKHEYIKKHNR